LDSFAPKLGTLSIIGTTKDAITLEANVSFKNPTEYSATVPFADVNILSNGTFIGHAIARNIKVVRGMNENVLLQAVWDPSAVGRGGRNVSRELLSRFISGEKYPHLGVLTGTNHHQAEMSHSPFKPIKERYLHAPRWGRRWSG
jgi:hypothetical protein